jgi:hypothetical protein
LRPNVRLQPTAQKIQNPARNAVKTDLQLPHDYEVDPDPQLPASRSHGRLFEFGSDRGAQTRCMVRVQLTGEDGWIGRFVGEYDEPPAISLVAASPNPRRVCVVCAGTGYLVDVDQPDHFEIVECFPICSVRTVASLELIVFGDFTDLVAYGTQGLAWKATDLVSDELTITNIVDTLLEVDGLNAATGETLHLTIDARTGALISR